MPEGYRLWLADRQVDLVTGDVVRLGEAVARLTTKERELLAYLAGRSAEDVERADLLTDVWGYARTARTRAVDFTVRRLRQKIESDPSEPAHVLTVHGVGYRFEGARRSAPAEPVTLQPAGEVPMGAVAADGPEPAVVELVRSALLSGARLITLVSPSGPHAEHVAAHVAGALGDKVLWLGGPLSALADAMTGADTPPIRRRLLRAAAPELVVLLDVPTDDPAPLDELADALRALPALRVLALSRRRLMLAAEHSLVVEPDLTDGGDLTRMDEGWATLQPDLRMAWTRLSACTGSVDLEGAEALLGLDAVDALDGLVDAGVLVGQSAPMGRRFRLRDAAVRYGRQRLGRELGPLRQQRRTWLLDRHAGLLTGLSRESPPGLADESAELHALWSDTDARPLSRVRAALLLSAVGHSAEEDRARLEAAESLLDGHSDAMLPLHLLRARLRLAAGAATLALDDARVALLEARQEARTHGEALAGALLATALMRLGRMQEAREAARQARQRLQQTGDRASEVELLQALGRIEHELGARVQAESTLREAVHLARLEGAPVPLADSLVALGTLYRHGKRLAPSAEAYDTAAEALVGRVGVEADLTRARLRLESAVLDLERGRAVQALGVLEPLAGELQRHGLTRDAGEAWLAVAGSRWQGGDLDGAVEGFERGRSAFESCDDRLYTGLALAWSGATAAAIGEVQVADSWLEQSREHLEPLGLQRGQDVLVACRAHLDLAHGRPVEQVLHWAHEVERSAETWGDVRLALRLLPRGGVLSAP